MTKVFNYLKMGLIIPILIGSLGFFGCRSEEDKKRWKLEREEYMKFCSDAKSFVEGTVLDHNYSQNLVPVSKKHIDGILSQAHSNKTMTIDSKFSVIIKTTKPKKGKILSLSIVDGDKEKEAVYGMVKYCKKIGKTPKISFIRGNINPEDFYDSGGCCDTYDHCRLNETNFTDSTNVGTKIADRVNAYCE